MFLAVAGLLGGLEIVLRLAGIGWPTGFFLPATVNGRKVAIENSRFTWRFMTPELARSPQPLALPVVRETNSLRVFVLGESAAMGDPEPAIGYPRVLQTLLEARLPGRTVEVVNVAITAINSHVIREIARDCATQAGDVWIIYAGNNEVMGPFGPGTVFGRQSPPPAVLRAGLWFKTTHTGQWFDQLARRTGLAHRTPGQWGGLEMFLEQQVTANDPRLGDVYNNFRDNLADIIDTGRRSGARVVVGTVAVNLKDSAPFGSRHGAGLSATALTQWEQWFALGQTNAAAGQWTEALAAWSKAAELDDAHAELAFRMGRALLMQGNTNGAAQLLARARDQDTLRFRADSRINEVIRQTCSNRVSEGVWLVDSERTFAVNSPRGIPGDELFWEHVHFRLPGSYLLALATGSAVLEALPETVRAGARPDWISLNEVAQRLVVTRWGDHRVADGVRSRLRRPPFSTQSNAVERDQRLQREVASLASGLSPTAFNTQAEGFRKALARNPDDWVLHDQFGRLHESFGDSEGAAKEWRRVIELLPHHAAVRLQLGRMLAAKDATAADAVPYLREALVLQPGSAEAHAALGQAFARQKQFTESYAEFDRSLRLRPDLVEAQLQWGLALAADRQTNAAQGHFERALTLNSNSALAHLHLARIAVQSGDTNTAKSHYLDVLRLSPNYREARQFFEGPPAPDSPSPVRGTP